MNFWLRRDGWVRGARWVPSPNCDVRPIGLPIDLLVVHCISLPRGVYGGGAVLELFTNRLDCRSDPSFADLEGLRVSSHFVIRRDGELVQCVSCWDRAWHAGVSTWRGRGSCNNFSIGVEFEGVDDGPYTPEQYQTFNRLQILLIERLPLKGLAAHSEIAPGRKTDPGPFFEWPLVNQGLSRDVLI